MTDELLSSHLMAFPSHFEGFPNALAEALAAGLPAVGCAGVSGVEDLICNNENGILLDLTDDASRWAEALARLMGNASLRERYGAQARRHMQAWRLETIGGRWERQLEAVARHCEAAA
jgi:glycosyltransferase involved in cell wall biosynthesis